MTDEARLTREQEEREADAGGERRQVPRNVLRPELPDEEERHPRHARQHDEDVRAPEALAEQPRLQKHHVDRRGVL
jgi:hypothetical protein